VEEAPTKLQGAHEDAKLQRLEGRLRRLHEEQARARGA
jgi:hypothetical protein